MAYYLCIDDAVQAVDDLKARKVLINEIISKLYSTMTRAAEKADVEEYYLNDGQTTVKAIKRSPKEIMDTIKALQAQLIWIDSQLCGRITYLRNGTDRG